MPQLWLTCGLTWTFRRAFESAQNLKAPTKMWRLLNSHPERFERPTPCFVGMCSIQLSYGCIQIFYNTLVQLDRATALFSICAPTAQQLSYGCMTICLR